MVVLPGLGLALMTAVWVAGCNGLMMQDVIERGVLDELLMVGKLSASSIEDVTIYVLPSAKRRAETAQELREAMRVTIEDDCEIDRFSRLLKLGPTKPADASERRTLEGYIIAAKGRH